MFARVKTWVYIFAIANMVFVFVDNLIRPTSMGWGWAVLIDVLIAIFRQMIALSIFHFFSKRSVKLMNQQQTSRLRRQQITMIVVAFVMLSIVVSGFITKSI